MEKIKDFGQKIGGARKDLWKQEGLQESDLESLTEGEKAKYVTRGYVWPLPNAKLQVENGLDPFIAYWQREVRKQIRKEPFKHEGESLDHVYKRYIRIVKKIKDYVMSITTSEDLPEFYNNQRKYFGEEWRDWSCCVAINMDYIHLNHNYFRHMIERNNFPYGKPRKKAVRKKKWIPKQLESIEREGDNYRKGRNVNAAIWQEEFLFYGVEFGNWMSQKDRQFSMNYCYDALKDLSYVLNIDERDIAFDGNLSLAFGARGTNSASAHYELLRSVINLTKMHGAGCTAHEWMHALDHQIAKFYDLENSTRKLASESKSEFDKLPKEFTDLVKALKHDSEGRITDYYRGSKNFDKHFAKDSYGYWYSDAEMLARAFGCYVKDCLGCKSDYLIAQADSYVFEFEDQSICAIPQGEEREIFNEMFDSLIYRLKKDGLFHKRSVKIPKIAEKTICYNGKFVATLNEESNGQLSFVF